MYMYHGRGISGKDYRLHHFCVQAFLMPTCISNLMAIMNKVYIASTRCHEIYATKVPLVYKSANHSISGRQQCA